MKNYIRITAAALCLGMIALQTTTSYAQGRAGKPAAMKAEAISKELNLTPEQKAKILPILADEGPKVQAIKNDNSLSKMQKVQQLRAIHQQTDPQMKSILSPAQYEKLKTIRQQAIRDATATYH